MPLSAPALLSVVLPGLLIGLLLRTSAADEPLLEETFADGAVALERWEFSAEGPARPELQSRTDGDAMHHAVYVDFRERASWRFMSREAFALEPGGQYTLCARVRCNLGYGDFRLVAETTDPQPVTVATVSIVRRAGEPHLLTAVFVAPAVGATVRVGLVARGYSEIHIEQVRLGRNVPPLSSYLTGLLLPSTPLSRARYRTGAFLPAEDLVGDDGPVTSEDRDGDGLWALCGVEPDGNPWLFSENTVIKSDGRSAEEGGGLPPLKLTATGLLPGPYQVFLSDPMRDAAISLDGSTWRGVEGGRGEIDLGLLEVHGEVSVWVAHEYRTEANPGPIYVDYLRLMPVYDAGAGLEQPEPPGPVPERPQTAATTLRLLNPSAIARSGQWVTTGLPFSRGAFQPGDGIALEGTSDLLTRPLVLWPDGSAKWLRVAFRADVPGHEETPLALRYGPGVSAAPFAEASVRRTDEGHVLRSGGLEARVRHGVWDTLALGGRQILSRPPSVVMTTASGMELSTLLVETVDVEDGGPHPGLRVSGRLGTAEGVAGPARFTARLTESAPETLGVTFSVVNEAPERYLPEAGCGPAVPLTGLSLVIAGVEIAPETVAWPSGEGPFTGERQTLLQTGSGRNVEEFAGEWTLTQGDGVLARGQSSPGWVDVRGEGVGLAVGVREFREKQPGSLSVGRGGDSAELRIGLWPEEAGGTLRYAQGTRLSVEFALLAHDGSISAENRQARLASVVHPVRAVLPPEHYCQSGVFGPLTPLRESRFESYFRCADEAFADLCSRRRAYGLEDWGDFFAPNGYVRGDGKLWTNMEWEYIGYLVHQFAATGDGAYLAVAEEAAGHFADIDVIHYSDNPAWRGGSYVHTGDLRQGHQVDPPDFAHAGWPQGLLWVYYLCGDESLPEAAVGLADYVVRNMPPQGPYQSQPPFSMWNCSRQAGNPILTLASVYEFSRDPEHLATLHRLVDFALRVQDPKLGCWSTPFYEEPVHHRPSPDYAGLLFRGLYTYGQLTGDRRVAEAFRRLEGFLLQRHPEERRRYLRPDSSYRRSLTNTGVPCALSACFSQDAGPVIELGLAELLRDFPPGETKSVDVRAVPGVYGSATLLLGAARPARP